MFGQNNSKPYRKAPKKLLKPPLQQKVNIIANTTFFGLDFDVLVLVGSISGKGDLPPNC